MQKNHAFKNIPGQKVRRQFFNIPIFFILSFDMALIAASSADLIKNANYTIINWLEDAAFYLKVSAVPLLPLIILSLLNHFCFGEVICVLSNQGMHYAQGLIDWNQIKCAVYHADLPFEVGRGFFCCNELHLTIQSSQKEKQIELDHAPFLLLRKIKKRCPEIPCKMSGLGIAMVLSVSFGLSIASVLMVLFE